MFGLGPTEVIIIIGAVVVFFFGKEKLSDVARGLGRFIGEFKKGRVEVEEELMKAKEELTSDGKQKPTRKR